MKKFYLQKFKLQNKLICTNLTCKNIICKHLNCKNLLVYVIFFFFANSNSIIEISDFLHMPCINIYNEREKKKADTISCSIVTFPTIFIFMLDKGVRFVMQIYFHAWLISCAKYCECPCSDFFLSFLSKNYLNELTDVMIVTDQFLVLFISYYAILNFWYQLLFSAEGKIQNFVFL